MSNFFKWHQHPYTPAKISNDDIIKWKHFPHYWPFVRGIHWSLVNSPHKGQWRRALMLSLNCAWINGWANNREAGDLRCHHTHYDVTVVVEFIHCIRAQRITDKLFLFVLSVEMKQIHDTDVAPNRVAYTLIARFMGPTWGPSGADRTHVGPMNWVSLWVLFTNNGLSEIGAWISNYIHC